MTIVEPPGSKTVVGRGRPKRELVDTVRVIHWRQFIREKGGLGNYQIGKELAGGKFNRNAFGDLMADRRWRRYEIGERIPEASLVDEMELKYPGSKEILNHKVWSLFRAKPPSDADLKLLLSEIRPSLVKCIGVLPHNLRFALTSQRTFESLMKLKKSQIMKKDFSGLDHFVALLIIAIDGKNKRLVPQYLRSIGCLVYMLPVICKHYFVGTNDEISKLFRDCYLFGGALSQGYMDLLRSYDGLELLTLRRVLEVELID